MRGAGPWGVQVNREGGVNGVDNRWFNPHGRPAGPGDCPGLSVCLGDSVAWRTQKVGVAGGLSAPHTARSCFGAVSGHVRERAAENGVFITGKGWHFLTVSFFNSLGGHFG